MPPTTADRGHPAATLLKLLAASVAAGVIVALIALPGIGSTGVTARDAADDFMNMDVEKITRQPAQRTVVYDSRGGVLVSFFDQFRDEVTLDKVAPVMQKAIVAIEDARFFDHGALDLKGTFRALSRNASSGEVSEGGSTLTQQLAKNMLVNNTTTDAEYKEVTAPTVTRKLRELRLALQLEQTMDKRQILQGYLNIAYFGAGAWGIEAASRRYFSKPAADLDLVQAATLAGITKSPYQLDPTINPELALARRNTVLQRMQQLNAATPAEVAAASKLPLQLKPYVPKGGCETSRAPYFCQYVYGELVKYFMRGKKPKNDDERQRMRDDARTEILRGGYSVRTTIDPKIQAAAEKGLRFGSYARPKGDKVAVNAMVEPGTGNIRAIAVSKKFGPDESKKENNINLAADAEHGGTIGIQAGSTFKTFTLLAALDQGVPIRTSFSSPSRITISGYEDCKGRPVGGNWSVGNAADSESGAFNLKNGTWHSVNTFYANLEKKVGLCESVEMARKFGMTKGDGSPLQELPSQVLGSNEVDMVHLSAAYAGIAARGKYCTPVAITSITDGSGKKLPPPAGSCKQVVDEQVADAATMILEGVLTQGTAAGLGIGRPAAAKTGTCELYTCAVFAGYTPDLASAIAYWDPRGNFRFPVTGIYGATVPGPMWRIAMTEALKGRPVQNFKEPVKDFGDIRAKAVPNVVGKPAGEAVAILKGAGFDVRVDPRPVKSGAPAGSVARVSPSGQAEEGAVVTIYISRGKGGRGNGAQPGWPF